MSGLHQVRQGIREGHQAEGIGSSGVGTARTEDSSEVVEARATAG